MSDQLKSDGPYQDAQLSEELARYVMGSEPFKTPAEWWARGEIESLRARIVELEAALKPISLWSFEAQDGSPAIKELEDDILRVRAALDGES